MILESKYAQRLRTTAKKGKITVRIEATPIALRSAMALDMQTATTQ